MFQLQHQNVIQSSNEDLSDVSGAPWAAGGAASVIINTTIITKCLQTFGTPCSKIRSNLVDNWSNKFLLEFGKIKKLISKFNWWTLSELIKVVWKVLKIGQKIFFSCYFNISVINQFCNGVSFSAVITKREHSVVVAPNCA